MPLRSRERSRYRALEGSRVINDDRWHHLVYTYENGAMKLYVDGALDASAFVARIPGGGPAFLGWDEAVQTHLAGSLDEVAVYDAVLTPQQIQAHYSASTKPLAFGRVEKVSGSYLRARYPAARATSVPFSLARVRGGAYTPFG